MFGFVDRDENVICALGLNRRWKEVAKPNSKKWLAHLRASSRVIGGTSFWPASWMTLSSTFIEFAPRSTNWLVRLDSMLTMADCMAIRPATPMEIIRIVRKVLNPELRIATRALKRLWPRIRCKVRYTDKISHWISTKKFKVKAWNPYLHGKELDDGLWH